VGVPESGIGNLQLSTKSHESQLLLSGKSQPSVLHKFLAAELELDLTQTSLDHKESLADQIHPSHSFLSKRDALL
jgi:hypothetical protein